MIEALLTTVAFDGATLGEVASRARALDVETVVHRAESHAELAAALRAHPRSEVLLADFLPDVHDPARPAGFAFEAVGGAAVATHAPPPDLGRIRWIQLTAAGVNQEAASATWNERPDVAITTASGVPSPAMVQWIVGAMLQHAEQLELAAEYRRTRDWGLRERFQGSMLLGRTLGILGLGGVGRRLAHVAHALGMRVIAVRARPGRARSALYRLPAVAALDGDRDPVEVWGPERLDTLLAESDVVVCTVPLTAATRTLLGARELERMKPGALFVNVSRGGVVDETALVEALRRRRIAAALDVFTREPLPVDSPLFDLGNVLLTPHVSGTHDCIAAFTAELFLDNLERWVKGLSLFNLVDRRAGY